MQGHFKMTVKSGEALEREAALWLRKCLVQNEVEVIFSKSIKPILASINPQQAKPAGRPDKIGPFFLYVLIQEVILCRPAYQSSGIFNAGFTHKVGAVTLYGMKTDEQFVGNLLA